MNTIRGSGGEEITRLELEEFLLGVLSDQGPWILDPHEPSTFRFQRELEPGRLVVGLLLAVGDGGAEEGSGGRVAPLVFYRGKDGWYASVGFEALHGWAGYYLARRVTDSPELMLFPSEVLRDLSERVRWLPTIGVKIEEPSGFNPRLSGFDEADLRWVRSVLRRVIEFGVVRDEGVRVEASLSLVLGRWSTEEFRRDYGLSAEFTDRVETAARREAGRAAVSSISEFVLVGRLDFEADRGGDRVGVRAEVSLRGVGFELKGELSGQPRMVERRVTLGTSRLDLLPSSGEDLDEWLGELKRAIRRILVTSLESDIAPTA